MPRFIEAHDIETGAPVAINTDTIARVYEQDDKVWLVLTTISTQFYEGVDDDGEELQPGASRSDRVACRGTYREIMQKIIAAG